MKVAIVGATGAVGREMIKDLAESNIKGIDVELYASSRSAGSTLMFRDQHIEVKAFSIEEAGKNDYILMSAGGGFSREYAKALVEKDCVVIDNSSAWRMDDGVPLVVPEVNIDDVKGYRKGIIANPNCSTIQMVVPLKALDDAFGLELVEASTYQSVSGSGQKGLSALNKESKAFIEKGDFLERSELYPKTIGFSVVSGIGDIDDAGHCEEEIKMVKETQKILSKADLDVLVTTVRVPVFNCHSETISVKLSKEVSVPEAWKVLKETQGLVCYEGKDPEKFHSPADVTGKREIFVSRLRTPYGTERSRWLQFWVVADNLKKGAASNAVQILEGLVR